MSVDIAFFAEPYGSQPQVEDGSLFAGAGLEAAVQPYITLARLTDGSFNHLIAAGGTSAMSSPVREVLQQRADHQFVATLRQARGITGQHHGVFDPSSVAVPVMVALCSAAKKGTNTLAWRP